MAKFVLSLDAENLARGLLWESRFLLFRQRILVIFDNIKMAKFVLSLDAENLARGSLWELLFRQRILVNCCQHGVKIFSVFPSHLRLVELSLALERNCSLNTSIG